MKALLFIVFFVLAIPAQAHTIEEQAEWAADWTGRVQEQGSLTPELIDEWIDFQQRHIPVVVSVVGEETTYSNGVTLIPPVSYYAPGVEQWRGLVASYPGWSVDRMLNIMSCESGGNPNAKNPRSSATGLFQVMASVWHDGRDLYDPLVNVDVAHYVWMQQGYSAWVCR